MKLPHFSSFFSRISHWGMGAIFGVALVLVGGAGFAALNTVLTGTSSLPATPPDATSGQLLTSANLNAVTNDMIALHNRTRNIATNDATGNMQVAGKVGLGILPTATGVNAELDIKTPSVASGNYWGIYHDQGSEDLRFWNGQGTTGNNRFTITKDGGVKADKYCNADGTKCLAFNCRFDITLGGAQTFTNTPSAFFNTLVYVSNCLPNQTYNFHLKSSTCRGANPDTTTIDQFTTNSNGDVYWLGGLQAVGSGPCTEVWAGDGGLNDATFIIPK